MNKKNSKTQKLNLTDIDSKGSLGLLAYGDLGLRLWRQHKKEKQNKEN